MAAKIVGLGLALSLGIGAAGCATVGPSGTPAQNVYDSVRKSMPRCGVTTKDLYMIYVLGGRPSPVWNDLNKVPCDQVPAWLDDYRATHGPQLNFMVANLQERLAADGLKSRLLLQVHDELVFEVAPGEQAALTDMVTDVMTHAMDLAVSWTSQ